MSSQRCPSASSSLYSERVAKRAAQVALLGPFQVCLKACSKRHDTVEARVLIFDVFIPTEHPKMDKCTVGKHDRDGRLGNILSEDNSQRVKAATRGWCKL